MVSGFDNNIYIHRTKERKIKTTVSLGLKLLSGFWTAKNAWGKSPSDCMILKSKWIALFFFSENIEKPRIPWFFTVAKTGHRISRFLENTRNTPRYLSEKPSRRMSFLPIHMVPKKILETNENHGLKLPLQKWCQNIKEKPPTRRFSRNGFRKLSVWQ
mgnify:CR=1 FL=1